ncbi:hypothetical protein ACQ4LE_003763 [Meloidogyne hapla]
MQEIFPPTDTEIKQLDLYKDEKKLWRAKGRIRKSGLNLDSMCPIFLNRKATIVPLLILESHSASLHGGVEIINCLLRKRFWIPKSRKLIRNIVFHDPKTKCGICARYTCKKYDYPKAPDLPIFRVKGESAFMNVGLDYFGPIVIKSKDCNKVWGAIFTCLLSRGIHIEIVTDCTSEKFLLAFRRFIRRRRTPRLIVSDNGKTFVLANKVIKQIGSEELEQKKIWLKIFNDKQIQKFARNKEIEWKFNTPLSPWRGGSFERLIQSIKFHLKRVVRKNTCTLEELMTLLVEIERIINERPLTYISSAEIVEPLRPIDILDPSGDKPYQIQFSTNDIEELNKDEEFFIPTPTTKNRDKLLSTYKKSIFKTHIFWKNWKESYLTALREKYETNRKNIGKLPKVGQVVLVNDDSDCPRSLWQIGLIKEIISDRTVKIKIGQKIFERPTKILYPLEIEED